MQTGFKWSSKYVLDVFPSTCKALLFTVICWPQSRSDLPLEYARMHVALTPVPGYFLLALMCLLKICCYILNKALQNFQMEIKRVKIKMRRDLSIKEFSSHCISSQGTCCFSASHNCSQTVVNAQPCFIESCLWQGYLYLTEPIVFLCMVWCKTEVFFNSSWRKLLQQVFTETPVELIYLHFNTPLFNWLLWSRSGWLSRNLSLCRNAIFYYFFGVIFLLCTTWMQLWTDSWLCVHYITNFMRQVEICEKRKMMRTLV